MHLPRRILVTKHDENKAKSKERFGARACADEAKPDGPPAKLLRLYIDPLRQQSKLKPFESVALRSPTSSSKLYLRGVY